MSLTSRTFQENAKCQRRCRQALVYKVVLCIVVNVSRQYKDASGEETRKLKFPQRQASTQISTITPYPTLHFLHHVF